MKRLTVFLDFGSRRQSVGELFFSEKLGKIAFAYDESFISSGLEIAPKVMPLGKETHVANFESDFYDVHPVFADSLPDSWGRHLQDIEFAKIEIQNVTALDRLAFVGRHGIGALQYEPALEFAKGDQIVTLAEMRKATQTLLKGEIGDIARKLIQIGGSAGGAQPKFLVDMDREDPTQIRYSTGLPRAGIQPILLKVPTRDDIWQRIEYTYSQMAKSAGLAIPQTHLILAKDQKAFFAINRFDLTPEGARSHTQTYAALDGYSVKQERRDYMGMLRFTHALCRNHRDVTEVYRRMVFNFLGSNQDDHGKNFSFLMDAQGRWALAPAYDIGFSDHGGNHRMSANGKFSGLKVSDFEAIAHTFEVREWKQILETCVDTLSQWPDMGTKNGVPPNMVFKISQNITANVKRVQKDLSFGLEL